MPPSIKNDIEYRVHLAWLEGIARANRSDPSPDLEAAIEMIAGLIEEYETDGYAGATFFDGWADSTHRGPHDTRRTDIDECMRSGEHILSEHFCEADGDEYSYRMNPGPEPQGTHMYLETPPGPYHQVYKCIPIETCLTPHPYPTIVVSEYS